MVGANNVKTYSPSFNLCSGTSFINRITSSLLCKHHSPLFSRNRRLFYPMPAESLLSSETLIGDIADDNQFLEFLMPTFNVPQSNHQIYTSTIFPVPKIPLGSSKSPLIEIPTATKNLKPPPFGFPTEDYKSKDLYKNQLDLIPQNNIFDNQPLLSKLQDLKPASSINNLDLTHYSNALNMIPPVTNNYFHTQLPSHLFKNHLVPTHAENLNKRHQMSIKTQTLPKFVSSTKRPVVDLSKRIKLAKIQMGPYKTAQTPFDIKPIIGTVPPKIISSAWRPKKTIFYTKTNNDNNNNSNNNNNNISIPTKVSTIPSIISNPNPFIFSKMNEPSKFSPKDSLVNKHKDKEIVIRKEISDYIKTSAAFRVKEPVRVPLFESLIDYEQIDPDLNETLNSEYTQRSNTSEMNSTNIENHRLENHRIEDHGIENHRIENHRIENHRMEIPNLWQGESMINNETLAIPGQQWQDFPLYNAMTATNFTCQKIGFFADKELRCQVYHHCGNNFHLKFICPNGTLYDTTLQACNYWFNVDCNKEEDTNALNTMSSDQELNASKGKETSTEPIFQMTVGASIKVADNRRPSEDEPGSDFNTKTIDDQTIKSDANVVNEIRVSSIR